MNRMHENRMMRSLFRWRNGLVLLPLLASSSSSSLLLVLPRGRVKEVVEPGEDSRGRARKRVGIIDCVESSGYCCWYHGQVDT